MLNVKRYPIKLPSIYLKFSLKQAKGQTNFCLSFPPMHGSRDDLILSAKLIRIAPETSSF
jgi:hypothetical protein